MDAISEVSRLKKELTQKHKVCIAILKSSSINIIIYHIAGMFGGINVWQIAELKVVGIIKNVQ